MQLKDISFKYHSDEKDVLRGISITFQVHKIYGLVGPNGAGKTTLLSIIGGVIKPIGGNINNDSLTGVHLQGVSMYDQANGIENLLLYCSETNTTKDNIDYVLSLVGIDKRQAKIKFGEYSQGYKQRLLIARSLLNCRGVIVLDEPFSSLDFGTIISIKQGLKKLVREKPVTLIISSHQLRELEDFVDYGLFIKRGEIIKQISQNTNALEPIYRQLFQDDTCIK